MNNLGFFSMGPDLINYSANPYERYHIWASPRVCMPPSPRSNKVTSLASKPLDEKFEPLEEVTKNLFASVEQGSDKALYGSPNAKYTRIYDVQVDGVWGSYESQGGKIQGIDDKIDVSTGQFFIQCENNVCLTCC